MIDIQEGPLRPFEQYTFAIVHQVLENLRHICRYWYDCLGGLHSFIKCRGIIDRLRSEVFLQQEIVVVEYLAKFFRKFLTHEKI